ncbi:TPA: hypothetical protein ACFRGQ_001930 [Neisseria lactamica]|uniref:hypothetical protein n=1 Tax=Neisseria lactamica TaxID=486 RepID=UPI001EFC4BBB|nr:hypothetical protein [Neisseria lactamica]
MYFSGIGSPFIRQPATVIQSLPSKICHCFFASLLNWLAGTSSFFKLLNAMHRADETGIAVQQEKPDFKTELADIQISSLPDSMLYRLENLRIAQEYYQSGLEHFRREEKMSRVRDKIREYAEKNGMSEQDVIAGINKDTDMILSEISQVFNEAYENSPAAKTAKEKMDHALNNWKDSYSSLTEDFGYGDTDNRDYRRAFGQYENSREDMEEATASVTKTLGEDANHFEQLPPRRSKYQTHSPSLG